MDAHKRDDLLAQEYLQLQKTVENCDVRAQTIKAWSVTFSAAGLGIAYQQGISILLLIASLSAATFWLIDANRKFHQHCLYGRIEAIEYHFAGGTEVPIEPLQIRRYWYATFRDPRRVAKLLTIPLRLGVMLPHAVIVAAGILLFSIARPLRVERSVRSANSFGLISLRTVR
jgi:hypothetical protein